MTNDLDALALSVVSSAYAVVADLAPGADIIDILGLEVPDHRLLPRKKRRKFDHYGALSNILREYLGPEPLFDDSGFQSMFRVSKTRFQAIMDDIGRGDFPFFKNKSGAGATMESRLLLPLKTLCFGVPPHTFIDYFQMSRPMARKACEEFDMAINKLYGSEYLRKPTAGDLKSIELLHFHQHKTRGMYGSLDCTSSSTVKLGGLLLLVALTSAFTFFAFFLITFGMVDDG